MPRGGRRPGAGRPRKAITLVRKTIQEANADAETALGFVIGLMQNNSLPIGLRFDCAKEIMDRVWGKATQKQEHAGTLHVIYEDVDDWRASHQDAAATLGTVSSN